MRNKEGIFGRKKISYFKTQNIKIVLNVTKKQLLGEFDYEKMIYKMFGMLMCLC